MTQKDLIPYEIGKEYLFKASSRKNRIRGILTSKETYYTGISFYTGCEAIEFKNKRGTKYTLVVSQIEGITNI
jgi:hypothetical protein